MERREIKEILRRYGVRPRKGLGQSFLLDEHIAESIADQAQLTEEDAVLEIGPGLGILTEPLLRKAGRVFAVEVERGLCEALRVRLPNRENLTLLNENVLEIDLSRMAEKGSRKLKIVSNLPYRLTSPILNYVLENADLIQLAILTVQNEVARRITAQPGGKEYGLLSVLVQHRASPEILFSIQPSSFYPSPRVVSTVVRLEVRTTPVISVDEPVFLKLLKACFSQRRKMLKNTLKTSFPLTAELLGNISHQTGIDLRRRAETLSLSELGELAKALKSMS